MIRFLAAISFLFFSQYLIAQEKVQNVRFSFTINGEPIELEKNYYLESISDSISINTLKLYISDFSLLLKGDIIDTTSKKYHLIDLEKPSSLKMDYSTSVNFDQIRFTLGIDSVTNVSGAMGGDLDPTSGMYWAWQSGYINFKLEGKSKACSTRNNVFQFHLGGYQFPNSSFRTMDFPISEIGPIVITIPIDKLLDKIDIRTTNEIMSPGKKSVQISEYLSSIIVISK